jgi:hypothetical protein
MDMKRILQALDGNATKPVVGVNDMAKFLSVVDKNSKVQLLQEASPHKVTLPVQMAMQHYQEPSPKKQEQLTEKTSSLRSYFKLVESEQFDKILIKDPAVVNRARIIAERIRLKEYSTDQLTRASVHNGPGLERLEDVESVPKKKDKNITTPTTTPIDKSVGAAYGGAIGGTIGTLGKGLAKALGGDAIGGAGDIISSTWDAIYDRIKLALEGNASEEEITQLQQEVVRLHKEAEESKERIAGNKTELAKKDEELAKLRDTYEQLEKAKQQAIILPTQGGGRPRPQHVGPDPFDRPLVSLRYESKIKEANAKKRTLKNSNPCWTGYHPVGTKEKGGKTVPNCVPKK